MKRRIITAIFIMTFLLVVAFAFSGCAVSGFSIFSQDIVISEVVASNSSSLQVMNLDAPDWIELYNTTDKAIELKGYSISRTDVKGATFTFESGIIEKNGCILTAAVDISSEDEFEYPCLGFKLPKEGCELVLKDPHGNLVGKITVPELESDISYAYHDGGYSYCLTATPGKKNTGLFFNNIEEMYAQKYSETDIFINEANRYFVELYNAGNETVELAYFSLSDNAADLTKWRFPAYQLQPDEYFVVRLDNTGEYKTSFSVSANEGYIYLALNGKEHDYADVTNLGENMSVGRNEKGERVCFIEVTEGEKNANLYAPKKDAEEMDNSAKVVITEMMLENKNTLVDEDGDRSAWVEIYNSSNQSVNLETYFLSDDMNELAKWHFPAVEIAGGEYVIVYLSGKAKDMHTSFSVSENEPLILTDFSNLEYQYVMFEDASRLDDVSYGLQNGEWLYFSKATPGRENTTKGSNNIKNADKLDKTNVFISEVSAVKPARSTTKDWIELYNPTESEIALDGLFLSDTLSELKKHTLSGSIAPYGYSVAYVSNETDFSISQAGETLYLSDGNCIFDVFETGALRLSTTSGRAYGDFSGERVFFDVATKGAKNATPLKAQLNTPVFSVDGGIKSEPFELKLAGDGEIYYTLNSTVPTKNSNKYSGPIKITENTVVTAVCIKEGHISSDAVTTTYLFEEKHTIPVICLTATSSDFNSVYAVETWSSKKSDIVERKCYIEYYEADGTWGTSFPAGFRVSGNSTRSYAQKSLGIYLRSGYGQTSVVYPFFDDYPITKFSSLTLRNAGQDYDDTRLVDAYAGMLFSDLNLDCAQSKFVAVYVNGRYWGLYDLKENQNESCFAYQHGVDENKINVIRRNTFAIAGTKDQIKRVYDYAQSWNLSNQENYERFCEYVDADAWIDYIIARSFCGDSDIFNQKLWNTNDYEIKWRPVFFDCDFSFRSKTSNTLFQYFTGEGFTTPDGSKTNMYIPTALKQNASWRKKFVERCAEVLPYYAKYSLTLHDEMVEQMKGEMQRHLNRWGFMSYSKWESAVAQQREIIEARPQSLVKHIQSVFSVPQEQMKTLFPDFY